MRLLHFVGSSMDSFISILPFVKKKKTKPNFWNILPKVSISELQLALDGQRYTSNNPSFATPDLRNCIGTNQRDTLLVIASRPEEDCNIFS
jgi:hypothetical protein